MKHLFILIALSALFAAQSATAVTVVNGSLTDVGGDYNSFNNVVPNGWENVPFGSTDTFDANTNFNGFTWSESADGGTFVHSLALAGFSTNEGITQEIGGLTIGQDYVVSFEQSISFQGGTLLAESALWQVTFGDETQNSSLMSVPSEGVAAGWQSQSLVFTATAESQLLQFQTLQDPELGSTRLSLGLDGIAVSVIPIPAAAWLFGSALGLLGWTRRKVA